MQIGSCHKCKDSCQSPFLSIFYICLPMEPNGKTYDPSIVLRKLSSRHHYIPQFLIEGFTNAEGKLYVYDKKKDRILKYPQSPKSIFFETDRNTVDVTDEKQSSVIEHFIYGEIDNQTSKVIRKYRQAALADIDFNAEDTAMLLFFLISLFWRIPKTDYAADDLMDRSEIKSIGIDPEHLRNDPTYRKLNRAGIYSHHINEIKRAGRRGTKWHNIHEFAEPVLLLGDYPMLFREQQSEFSEFDEVDVLLPVSATRIYSCTNEPLRNFTVQHGYRHNASIIEQSVRYVAAADSTVLEQSIAFYKGLKSKGLIYWTPEQTFNTTK